MRAVRHFVADHLTPRQRSILLAIKWRLRPPEPEVKLVCRIVSALGGGLVIDVGANRGLYTLALARHADLVHSFEANPILAVDLKAIIPANVYVHSIAVSDRSGTATLCIPIVHGRGVRGRGTLCENNRFTDMATDAVENIEVCCKRLDDIFDSIVDCPPVSFIKVDVEGLEYAVLNGARHTLLTSQPVVMVETEARHGADMVAIFQFLNELAYSSYCLNADGIVREISVDAAIRRQGEYSPDLQTEYPNNFLFLQMETAQFLKDKGIEIELN